jgi:hypothetical protein
MKVNQFHGLVIFYFGEPQRHYGEGRSYCPHQQLNRGHPVTSFTEMT